MVYWASVIGVGIASIIFGTVALLVFASFGTGKAIKASGFDVPAEQLSSCSSLVIDVADIALKDVPDAVKWVGANEYLTIATSNELTLQAILSSQDTIDQALLGRTSCILSLEPAPEVSRVSSGDDPLLIQAIEPTIFSESGDVIEIPLQIVKGSSLVIEGEFDSESDLRVNGMIYFAQSQNVLLFAGLGAISLLMMDVALIIYGVVRRNRRRSATDGAT